MRKIIFNLIGSVSLGIGILGVFLPLLPSTCFILLSTWAFAKSSPTFHAWLYYQSPFAQSIQQWHQHRVIPTRVKWIATCSIIMSYSLTVVLIENVYIVSGVGIGLVCLIIYLLSKPSLKQEVICPRLPLSHQQVV